jgi:hypothetical protein
LTGHLEISFTAFPARRTGALINPQGSNNRRFPTVK